LIERKGKMIRVQFIMDEAENENLQNLMQRTGSKTRTQTLNLAIDLLEWAVKERQDGRAIGSLDERTEKFKELLLPCTPWMNRPVSETEIVVHHAHKQPATPKRVDEDSPVRGGGENLVPA
jgi:hypothetical protein